MAGAVKVAAVGGSIAALASQPTFRNFFVKWSGIYAPGGVWRILAILFALGNLKNLPFVWHLRFFRAFTYHLYLQPTTIPPNALFKPIITSTRTPITEIDYNMHKSNSTYFSDMDISRTHLFTAIIRRAIRKSAQSWPGATDGTGPNKGQAYMIALGGIACNFKKEILPYKKYEMWTRLLTWDRKWFYLVTWLVKPGVGAPTGFSLQPWRKVRKAGDVDKEKLRGAVYAAAIAKYVIKRGRITIPPEQCLLDAEMVPKKPEGWVHKGDQDADAIANGDAEHVLPQTEGEEWNWDVIEKERRRGLKFAEAFVELDGLTEVFDGGKDGALGEYADLLWR